MSGANAFCDGCEMPLTPGLPRCRFCGSAAADAAESQSAAPGLPIPQLPDPPARPPPGIEGFDTRRWRNIFIVLLAAGGFWLWSRPSGATAQTRTRAESCRQSCQLSYDTRPSVPAHSQFMSRCLSECLAPEQ